jgi:hypothetical protein
MKIRKQTKQEMLALTGYDSLKNCRKLPEHVAEVILAYQNDGIDLDDLKRLLLEMGWIFDEEG